MDSVHPPAVARQAQYVGIENLKVIAKRPETADHLPRRQARSLAASVSPSCSFTIPRSATPAPLPPRLRDVPLTY